MTFFPRMLKTLKLLAMTPLATVLWFGVLGGMVWRLEPDSRGRKEFGSAVGRLVHGDQQQWYGCSLRLPPVLVEAITTTDGQWHVRTRTHKELGVRESDFFPSLNGFDSEQRQRRVIVWGELEGSRGVFAPTTQEWEISGFEHDPVQLGNSQPLSKGVVDAMTEVQELSEVIAALSSKALKTDLGQSDWSSARITRPIWSGYVYNGVMAVLLLAGLHSMRWLWWGVPLRQLRQVWRPNGECGACGYSLAGLNAAKCPECGGVNRAAVGGAT